jgi:hypothetical protein
MDSVDSVSRLTPAFVDGRCTHCRVPIDDHTLEVTVTNHQGYVERRVCPSQTAASKTRTVAKWMLYYGSMTILALIAGIGAARGWR